MKTKLLPLASVIVLFLATISIVRTQPHTVTNEPASPPPRSAFEHRIAAVGLIEPRSENISIASHLPGVVDQVLVSVGQDVQIGTPLVKLDTRALEAAREERRSAIASRLAAVETANAQVQREKAALAEARRNLKFAETLSDPRSLSTEERERRRSAVELAEAGMNAAESEVIAARAAVKAAEAALASVATDIERSTVTSPIKGRVLQVRIRPGEYAAGPGAAPWMILGDVSVLHVRVDVDEHEAWRVRPEAKAIAQVRGNATLQTPAHFVRFEPLVIPKQSLTGASTERVDTRVLQAIYRIETNAFPLFPGQQMDVFIEAQAPGTGMISHTPTR